MTEAPNPKVEAIQVPHVHAHQFALQISNLEFSLVIFRNLSTMDENNVVCGNMKAEPLCVIQMSSVTAKELAVILANAVGQVEQMFGPIVSPNLQATEQHKKGMN